MSEPDDNLPADPGRGGLPSRALVAAKMRDRELLEDYANGLNLRQLAEKHGLGNPKKAAKVLDAALRRLDERLTEGVGTMRAAEYLNLQRLSAALDDKASDPKAAAELRLQSESRRRLYGVDLDRKVEGHEPVVFVVDMRVPDDRQGDDSDDVVEVAEFEDMPPPALEAGDDGGAE